MSRFRGRILRLFGVLVASLIFLTGCVDTSDEGGESGTSNEGGENGTSNEGGGDGSQKYHPFVDATSATPVPDLSAFDEQQPDDLPPRPELCTGLDDVSGLKPPDDAEPEQTEAGFEYSIEYVNSLDQKFMLTFRGGDKGLVKADVAETEVCLEATTSFKPWAEADAPPSLYEILLEAVEAHSSVEALAKKRDDASEDYSPTLRELLGDQFSDVRTEATDAALSEYPDEKEAIERAIEDLLDQPDAPFLVDPAERPTNADDYDALARRPDVLILEIAMLEPAADNGTGLTFVVDPVVNRIQNPVIRYYQAKCNEESAYVKLHPTEGRMTLELWNWPKTTVQKLKYGDAAWATDPGAAAVPPPGGVGRTNYDVRVHGHEDGSKYWLGGFWALGGGCAAP